MQNDIDSRSEVVMKELEYSEKKILRQLLDKNQKHPLNHGRLKTGTGR